MPIAAAIAVTAVVVIVAVRTSNVRGASERSKGAWNLELLLLPTTLALKDSLSDNASAATAAILLALLIYGMFRTRPSGQWDHAILAMTLVSAGLAMGRSPIDTNMAIYCLAFAVLFRASRAVTRNIAVTSLIDGIGLYLLLNVGLYYGLGISSHLSDARLSGAIAGSTEDRVFFPLAASLNMPPNMAAVYVAAVIPLLMVANKSRAIIRLIFLGASVAILVLANSRTSLIAALFLALLVTFLPAVLRSFSTPAILALSSVGFVFPIISGSLAATMSWLSSIIPGLDRGDGFEDFSTLHGRSTIWQSILQTWSTSPPFEKIFGYGFPGQVRSGASSSYAGLFESYTANPESASAHNSMLQQLIDGGAAGVLFLVILWLVTVRRFSQDSSLAALSALAALTALALATTTEVSTAPGYAQPTYWLLTGLVFAASFSRHDPLEDSDAPTSMPEHGQSSRKNLRR